MAAAPTLLLVALATIHAGCTTGLTMHIVLTKGIVNCVTSNSPANTIALATTKALAASPLVLMATRIICAATIAVSTTRLVATTPSLQTSVARIETLASIAIHRENRAPPLHDRLPRLKLFPR
jgi:hypothetical protein